MRAIINFLEKYFVPIAGKIGSQRHLVAIRDGFVILMPLIIAGSMGVLINNLPLKWYQSLMPRIFGEGWRTFGGHLWEASFGIMSLLAVCTIAYSLAKHYKADGMSAAVVSLGSLLVIMEATAEGAIPTQWTGALGLFVAIFVALIATEVFVKLAKCKKLIIKMPDGVPPAVSKSFAALLPACITLAIVAIVKILFTKFGVPDIHKVIYDGLQGPLSSLANTMGSAIIIALLNHLFWFFGLHGSNILEPVMQAVYLPALDANMAAGPGLFNINEPMIYGLPIVLNPVFFIPFILTPVVLTILSYLAISIGLVPHTIAMVPWTTPPILSGFLATGSWRGSVLQIVNLAIGIAMYFPFIKMAEKLEDKQNKVEV